MHSSIYQLPQNSIIKKSLPVIHYSDSFNGHFTNKTNISLTECLRHFFLFPGWFRWLLNLRNVLAKPFGLKTESSDRGKHSVIPIIHLDKGAKVGFFTIVDFNDVEVVLQATDSHLDACASIMLCKTYHRYEINISTIVQFHNTKGKIYFFFVKPFHILIMKIMTCRIIKHFNQN